MDHAVTVGAEHRNVIKPVGHLSIMRVRRFATKFALHYPAMSQSKCLHKLRFFNGRGTMRTLADGLEKLRELQPDLGDRPISIKTQPMRLPTGELTAIVALVSPEPSDDPRWAVALPSCAQFFATTTLGGRQRYDIAQLNDTTVDLDGNVRLRLAPPPRKLGA